MCAWARSSPCTSILPARRWTGGGTGRADSNISILLQRELRCEKFSDLLWSQQMASSTRTRGKKSPFDARPVFLLHMSVCLHRGLQFGCCKRATAKKPHNGSAQNSGRFAGTAKTYAHYLLGLPSASSYVLSGFHSYLNVCSAPTMCPDTILATENSTINKTEHVILLMPRGQ